MSEQISIEGFTFDVNKLVKQLKQDMNNDWFPDPLEFADYLKPKAIKKHFKDYTADPSKKYFAGKANYYNIPKKGFTLRYGMETSLHDRMVYHAFGALVVTNYDHLLGQGVFSFRKNVGNNEKYLFRDRYESWKRFEAEAKAKYIKGTVIIAADIQTYFENIRLDDLHSVLDYLATKLKSKKEVEIMGQANAIIVRLLKKWAVNGNLSIPQNKDVSSFLGNLYIHKIDIEMEKLGVYYYRYMDDMRIICSSTHQARSVLKKLILELRKIGLTVNSQKSFILKKEDEKAKEVFKKNNPVLGKIDKLFKSEKWKNLQKAFSLIEEVLLAPPKKRKINESEFKFFLYRLRRLASCDETRDKLDYTKLSPRLVKELDDHPDICEHFIGYFKIVPLEGPVLRALAQFLVKEERRVYTWQCYLLWQLFVLKKYRSDDLILVAREIVSKKENTPNTAGAALYLGACGELGDKLEVAKKFKGFKTYQVQRNAIIATHELNYADHIEPNVKEYVLNQLKGTFRTLSTDYSGHYAIEPERISVSELCRDLTPYNL